MQINKSDKIQQTTSSQEESKTNETKQAKPSAMSSIPDTFEKSGKNSSPESSKSSGGESSAIPKQSGQITGGILIKQMTAARLNQAGVKLSAEQGPVDAKEQSGQRELTTDERKAADSVNVKELPQNSGLQDGRTAHEDEEKQPCAHGAVQIPAEAAPAAA